MQWMQIFDRTQVPVRDDFLIWPKRWSAIEEAAAIEAWAGPEPKIEDFPDVVAYARAYVKWVQKDGKLTKRQRLYISALTNRNNINRALAFIAPLTFSDFEYETACQVHGNYQQRPCGCAFDVVFDHHLARLGNLTDYDLKLVRSRWVCEGHARLNSLEAQFWTSAWDSGPNAKTWRYKGDVASSVDDVHRLLERDKDEYAAAMMEADAAPQVQ
jgi:hypothetical protein